MFLSGPSCKFVWCVHHAAHAPLGDLLQVVDDLEHHPGVDFLARELALLGAAVAKFSRAVATFAEAHLLDDGAAGGSELLEPVLDLAPAPPLPLPQPLPLPKFLLRPHHPI